MRDKRKMIIIGAVVLIIIVLVVVFVVVKKSSEEKSGMQPAGEKNEMGIQYGGDFNEFQYIDEEESETASEETESVNIEELKAMDQKLEEEYIKNKTKAVASGEADGVDKISQKRGLAQPESTQEETDTQENVEENTEEAVKVNEDVVSGDVISGQKSSGYAEYEVLCDAETQADAEAVAAQIGGTVLECKDGVAVIKIAENVDDLLARLEQQGSSLELYRNYNISIP